MRGVRVIQGGLAEGPGTHAPQTLDGGCAEAVDRILRRRLAALRRPLALVDAGPTPVTARPIRSRGTRRPARTVARDHLVGVRP